MHDDLRAKKSCIHHSEVPADLLGTPKRGRDEDPVDRDGIKKIRAANHNNWHPKLREQLVVPMRKAGSPPFMKIMKFCDADPFSIVQKNSGICAPNLFFGRCFHGEKCERKHVIATDAQVPEVLKLVSKFVKNPDKLSGGQ